MLLNDQDVISIDVVEGLGAIERLKHVLVAIWSHISVVEGLGAIERLKHTRAVSW